MRGACGNGSMAGEDGEGSSGHYAFAFHKAYPQKRITAEIELIDKRNVQTYVESAVVRPLTIPSGAQIPLLTRTARDLTQPKFSGPARPAVRVAW